MGQLSEVRGWRWSWRLDLGWIIFLPRRPSQNEKWSDWFLIWFDRRPQLYTVYNNLPHTTSHHSLLNVPCVTWVIKWSNVTSAPCCSQSFASLSDRYIVDANRLHPDQACNSSPVCHGSPNSYCDNAVCSGGRWVPNVLQKAVVNISGKSVIADVHGQR